MQDSNRFPGAFLVAVDELASDSKTKQHILVGLSAALSALSRRMQSQGDNATQITFLAVRAEKIADRAWALNASSNQHFDRDSQALAAEVKAFAATAAAASLRAGEQALLGREVALAIGAHADDISLLARDIHALPDAAAVRARLRPLSNTLSQLPERLKASAVTAREVGDIAALALGLGARADRLATGGLNASKEAAELCQGLRIFAEAATQVSLEMTRASALAVQAINDMATKTVGLSRGQTISNAPFTANERMLLLVQAPPAGVEIWTHSQTPSPTNRGPEGAVVPGSMSGRKT
jgi:hypothetical protein